jgi:hypothetical protein
MPLRKAAGQRAAVVRSRARRQGNTRPLGISQFNQPLNGNGLKISQKLPTQNLQTLKIANVNQNVLKINPKLPIHGAQPLHVGNLSTIGSLHKKVLVQPHIQPNFVAKSFKFCFPPHCYKPGYCHTYPWWFNYCWGTCYYPTYTTYYPWWFHYCCWSPYTPFFGY